ncbi:hypothetical protein ACW14Y_41250 [Kitasatospora sp. cg17-2]
MPSRWPAGTGPLVLLPGGLERVVGEDSTLDETVMRILTDTALTPPSWTPSP